MKFMLVPFTVLLFIGCAELQGRADDLHNVNDKKDAICQFVNVWVVDNPELKNIKKLCDADASLKKIAAEYAGCKAE